LAYFFGHLNFLTSSINLSGGGGAIFSLGGVHPYLRHMACTSDPDSHLKSLLGVEG